MPFLTITTEDGQKATHELSGDAVTVGRNDDNTLHLDEGSLSGSHAEFRAGDEGGYTLVDLGSTNGTFVDGEQITEMALADGARVMFGSLEGLYTVDIPSEEQDESPAEDVGEFPQAERLAAEVGDTSYRPDDFSSISPFPKRSKAKDPIAKLFLAIGGISIIVSILAAVCAVIMKAS
jgi:pSer/pThr/pTyr-binding forkhead associated (FHA) protein